MSRARILRFLPLLLALAACAAPRQAAKPGRPEVPAARQQQPLTLKQKQQVEQFYYQAVSAYSADDIKAASYYLSEIFKLDPSYVPAKELQKKVRLAGEKH